MTDTPAAPNEFALGSSFERRFDNYEGYLGSGQWILTHVITDEACVGNRSTRRVLVVFKTATIAKPTVKGFQSQNAVSPREGMTHI